MKKTIEVIIDEAGGVKISAVGFVGSECEKGTAFLEEALGKIARREHKPEFYRRACVKQIQRLQR